VIEVTADANIYISGLVFAGPPRRFLQEAQVGRFPLAISDALLEETQPNPAGKIRLVRRGSQGSGDAAFGLHRACPARGAARCR